MSIRNAIDHSASKIIVLLTSLMIFFSITAEAQVKQISESGSKSERANARPFHHRNMIDVSRSNLFTDFSDTINSTVSSGQIFNNSATGNNGGYFHLGTSATDVFWGVASSSGGSPFAPTLANSATFFGHRENLPLQFLTYNAIRMTIAGGGNVGIGTTNPTSLFQVLGNTSNASLIQARNQNTTAGTSYGMFLAAGTNSTDYVLALRDAADNDLVRVLGNGNFGIGTISPSYKLQVVSPPYTTGLGISFDNATEQALQITNTHAGGKTWSIGPGIGNAAADFGIYNVNDAKLGLTVYANGSVNTNNLLSSSGNNGLPSAVGGIVYITGGYSSPDSGRLVFGDGSGWKMHFSKRSGSATTDLITFQDNGNITAAGTIDAGTIKARYQDVAEWVPASEQLSAGTVVVLDSTKSNQVTSSTVSYDTRVAGVVSEQPGIALGEKSDGKVLVATTGRVRVKVDATKSPIHIGDLLVTSDVPGMAMKSEPIKIRGRQIHAPGTLIGKALEPLEKRKGTILVLLSLQ